MDRKGLQAKIAQKTARLELYRKREEVMLSPDGVKSYGIGQRNVDRYDTALRDIQKMIETLEQELDELLAGLNGAKPRRAVAVVPQDW